MTSQTAHNEHTAQNNDYDELGTTLLLDNVLLGWQQTLGNLKHSYASAADNFVDEILLTVSQTQINDALNQFVVKNVGLLHHLSLQIHDGYLRLSCTADVMGMFISVASDFRLVHLQVDRHTQRLVLQQISDTDIIELHAKKWFYPPAIRFAVSAYRRLLRKDPLPFILNLIKIKGVPFVEYKGNVIYLEIGRWLGGIDHFQNTIRRAQVNNGELKPQQLLIKLQPNFGEILSFGDPNADIITHKDNPNKS